MCVKRNRLCCLLLAMVVCLSMGMSAGVASSIYSMPVVGAIPFPQLTKESQKLLPEEGAFIERWQKSAEQGDAEAQYRMGYNYYHKCNDEREARKWFDLAIAQDNEWSWLSLAECYHNAIGVGWSDSTACEYYIKAAEAGNLEAMCETFNLYMEGGWPNDNEQETRNWLLKSAEGGYEGAQMWLATEAWDHRTLSEKEDFFGDHIAGVQYQLGLIYLTGYYSYDGPDEQDYTQAIKAFQKAIELGSIAAKTELGWCYYEGLGVEQNEENAKVLFAEAAEAGDAKANYMLGVLCLKEELPSANDSSLTDAGSFFRRAAETGFADAEYALGYCFFYGLGVEQDYSQAVQWFQKAAENDEGGLVLAVQAMAYCYANGTGVEKDQEQADKLYRRIEEEIFWENE